MNFNNPLFKHTLYIGVILGVTLSAFELLAFFLGILNKPIMSYINIALIVSTLIIALRKYRDQNQDGLLSFGNAFLVGLLTCLFSGFIWSIFKYFEYSLAPQLIDNVLLLLEERFLETNMAEDQIETMMEFYKIFYTPPVVALSTFFFNMGFLGAILSLILASIYKKEATTIHTN